MSSAEAEECFQATFTYKLLKSQAIRKAGSRLLLFLRDTLCEPYCASVECYENLTPIPLNGTSEKHCFDWKATGSVQRLTPIQISYTTKHSM